MKKFLLSALVSLVAFAGAKAPTYYECRGPGIVWNYDLTGREAVLILSGKTYRGFEISVQGAAVGKLISVVTTGIDDRRTRHATVVLPAVNLEGQRSLTFRTQLIRTEVSRVPQMENSFSEISCKAS